MDRRLSDSSSSSSEDERPSFGGSVHHGFDMGNARVENSSFSDDSIESPKKKRRLEDESDSSFQIPTKKARTAEDTDDSIESPKKKRRLEDESDSSFQIPTKKGRIAENTDAQSKAERMMQKMGYKKGLGLGKDNEGRLEPVEASKHKGRRGLGHYNDKLKDANLRWDASEEVVSVREEITWLNNSQQPVESKELDHWMGLGPAKKTIDDECTFCDPDVVMQVVNSKSVFDDLDKNEMRRARTRSNPYETIRGAFFLNRAAVKMANMDKVCDFMFTKPEILKTGELLYFADVCAGPGGFSEYVLWRKKWHAKGFGFTLKESNDFKLEDFYMGTPETFHPYYGPKGDGDVYNPENQEAFRELIMRQTNGEGVHFMMSDGGFSVEGQESIQEILSKQLYLCQCLVALMIVRKGGNFVTKVFDLFTPFSAGLVYLMYRCFKSVSIFKPNTSRPANSERYLICKGKHANVQDVIAYLARANRVLQDKKDSRDVLQLVPHDILEEDVDFFQYLKDSNNSLGRKQVVGLLKIAAFCEDTTLFEHRQAEMRKECLEYWDLPDQTRTIPRNMKPDERLKSIIKSSSLRFLTSKATELTTGNLDSTILKEPYDWFCMPCGSGQSTDNDKTATFYMGMGRTKSFRYSKGAWIRVNNLELPPDTLVYAEMIPELRGEYRHQRKTMSLHILDVYMLGTEDVSQRYLEDRYELTKIFCEALWKPTSSEFIRVRAKELHFLPNNLAEKLSLKRCVMKNGAPAMAYMPPSSPSSYDNDGDEPYYYVPNSLLFLKGTAQNWSRHISRTSGYPYYFNCKTNSKLYDKDKPAKADAAFPESIENRVVWHWHDDPALTIEGILTVIQNKLQIDKGLQGAL